MYDSIAQSKRIAETQSMTYVVFIVIDTVLKDTVLKETPSQEENYFFNKTRLTFAFQGV